MYNALSKDELFIKKIGDILLVNLENEQFGVENLAEELNLSRSQLHRKLNAINGKSTSQFIREFRLEKAMKMLQNNVATASEIAYRVGFGSPTYFNTSFNQYYGYPPGEVKFRNSLNDEDNHENQPSNNTTENITIKRRLFNLRTYVIVALSLILIITIYYYNHANSETAINKENIDTTTINEKSIAVLPFKNMSGNPDNEAFCDGMTIAIISRLSKIKGINKVISQTSMMNYKDNKKAMPEIADELKVHYILESGFQKSGNDIKINLQLIDGKSDKLFWSQEYEGKYDSIFKIQAEVAELVAKQLNAEITQEEHLNIRQTLTNNMEAYDNYLQGLYLNSNTSTNKIIASRKYFESAIALDSTFVEAYLQLGRSYSMMGTWFGVMSKKESDSLAAPYLKKALQLDPKNLDLIYSMAEKELFNWNFKVADSLIKVYEQQREENLYSVFLDLLFCRYDQVIKSSNRLLKEDPDAAAWWPTAYAYYFKGEKDSSLYFMHKGLQLAPNYEAFYDHFGNIYLAMGDFVKAKDVLETGLQISDKRHASMLVHLAVVYHYLGDEKKSLQFLNEVIDRVNKGEPEINVFVAHYYARLGNHDEAFKWLDKAYAKHEVDLIWLKADPNLLLLKNDPRYKVLCRKIGFPKIK